MKAKEDLQENLALLSDKPGVYLMYNAAGSVIYVGKAVSLKNRVRSYFSAGNPHSRKIQRMVNEVDHFETIVTASELEALILECNLIKQYHPYYNSLLKDDKGYPYLRIDVREPFPRLTFEHQFKQDGARYFGPYLSGTASHTLQVIRKVFPLRTCNKQISGSDTAPCLNYQIKHCCGPCIGAISQADYGLIVQDVLLFLEGKHEELAQTLQAKMETAAENLQFEKAAQLRDQWQAVQRLQEKQRVSGAHLGDRDVIAMAQAYHTSQIQIFYMRSGRIIGRDTYSLDDTAGQSRSEILSDFIRQYYSQVEIVPREILVQEQLADAALLQEWLSQSSGRKVEIKTPQRGEKRDLVELVASNALQTLGRNHSRRLHNKEEAQIALQELKKALSLPEMPLRIEAYDISNTQGTFSVASMVVFSMGIPDNKAYRRFRIKTVDGPNDFASMAEVIRRRFSRAVAERQQIAAGSLSTEKAKFAVLPDLILIDGGKGQLGAARAILHELGFAAIATIGLAKQFELIYQEGRDLPIELPPNSRSLFLLQRIRDEAHRFAITYHRNLRGTDALRSQLEQIPGIGVVRTRALLKKFDSLEKLALASLQELADTPGMNVKAAEQVAGYLRQNLASGRDVLNAAEATLPFGKHNKQRGEALETGMAGKKHVPARHDTGA
ncbi:MAG: excinuclease ABC subunit UvrC [Negativicutes bacterium]|nr:excinuclease ABC subunit UvrC [Negativicutes bacterium]